MASGSRDKTILIWDTETGVIVKNITGHTNSIRALTVLQNGLLVSSARDNTIKIWNPLNDWSLVQTLNGHSDSARALNVLQNGYLASGADDLKILIWKIN